MTKLEILNFLEEAVEKPQEILSLNNPFKTIGFDGGKSRLGWVLPPSFSQIRDRISKLLRLIEDKDNFIFVGMGGSINGIKALLGIKNYPNICTLDSLDPLAIEEVLSQVEKPSKVLVISISKSGSTLETQLLSETLKGFFQEEDNFLWLSDPSSFDKLNNLGWAKVKHFPIQLNSKEDIGGRFSCPHTLIFLLPLFLILQKDFAKLERFWEGYTLQRSFLIDKAYKEVEKIKRREELRLFLEVGKVFSEGFSNWARQLFQESLGSKDSFWIKTMVDSSSNELSGFLKLDTQLAAEDKFQYLAKLMYYLEIFVAFLSCYRRINFVNQPYVEVYKKELKNLKERKASSTPINLEELADKIRNSPFRDLEFIDCILYFWPQESFKKKISNYLSSEFPQKIISVFLGSDWNHHSYQSAFKDRKTLYLIIALQDNERDWKFLSRERALTHIQTLQAISYATFKTLQDKALYFSLRQDA